MVVRRMGALLAVGALLLALGYVAYADVRAEPDTPPPPTRRPGEGCEWWRSAAGRLEAKAQVARLEALYQGRPADDIPTYPGLSLYVQLACWERQGLLDAPAPRVLEVRR